MFLNDNRIYNIYIINKSTKDNIRSVSDKNRSFDDLIHTLDHKCINQ